MYVPIITGGYRFSNAPSPRMAHSSDIGRVLTWETGAGAPARGAGGRRGVRALCCGRRAAGRPYSFTL